MHDIGSPEYEGDEDEQNHVQLNLTAAVHQLLMALVFPIRISLGNLGGDSLEDVQTERQHGVLQLSCYLVYGIDSHAEGPVDDEDDALARQRLQNIGGRGYSGVFADLPQEFPIQDEMIPALRELDHAIYLVDNADDDADHREKDGIHHQSLVLGYAGQAIGRAPVHQHLKDGDERKGIHLLMGDDEGIVGNGDHGDDARGYRQLEDPERRITTSLRYSDAGVQEPNACNLKYNKDKQRQQEDDIQRRTEDLAGVAILTTQLKGDESLYGRRHSSRKYGEQSHDAAHDIVDAHILHSEIRQHQSCGP